MTSAHRPTWAPAKGKEHQGGARLFGPSAKRSKLDAAGFLTLKTRASGQSAADELLERDLRRELEEKERRAQAEKSGRSTAAIGADETTTAATLALGDASGVATERFAPRAEDADDDASEGEESGSGSDSESDSESDDDGACAFIPIFDGLRFFSSLRLLYV
jgi:protein CWC15